MLGSPSALSNARSHSCSTLESHWRIDFVDSSTPDALASGSSAISRKLRFIVSAVDASIQKTLQNLKNSRAKHMVGNSKGSGRHSPVRILFYKSQGDLTLP